MPSRIPEAQLSISAVARLAGMHVNTIRKYERHRLIAPARTTGNQRVFSHDDLARLRQIRRLVEERGVNLAGVDIALSVTDRVRALLNALADDAGVSAGDVGVAMEEILLTLLAAADVGCRLDNGLEDSGD
jgi:MerR family transcriptional regulator, heat shock protein HspR